MMFVRMLAMVLALGAALPVLAAPEGPETPHTDPHPATAADKSGGGDAKEADPQPLSFDPDLSIFTAIVFLILLAVLSKFAWGPIVEGLEKRELAIAQNIAAAERTNREARDLLVAYEKRIAEANAEVQQLLDRGRREAEAQSQAIVHHAEEVAAAEKDRAVAAIGAAKDQALRELAQKSVDTAIGLATRVLRKEISPQQHSELIGETLAQFPNRN